MANHSTRTALLLLACAFSNAFGSVATLKRKVASVLAGKDLNAGIIVTSMTRNDVLFERNANQLVIPASVAKLFTTYAALKTLGPTFTFRTGVFTKGSIRDGTLHGDLYLVGGGDPSLVSERMWMLVNDLMRTGLRRINGDIIGDATFFDSEKNPQSRPSYLKDQAYNSPISALSFNFNTTTIYVKATEPDKRPMVYIDPENSYITVKNQATTGDNGSANTLAVNRADPNSSDEEGDTVLLRGSVPMDAKELRFYRNIVSPAFYTASMFKSFCDQRELKVKGKIREGRVPDTAQQIHSFESLPLWQIIWGMNKFSNNFVADMILKELGAQVYGPPGSRERGIKAVQQAITQLKIPPQSYTLVDGSGLTRNTRVTARQVMTILQAFHREFDLGPEAISSLAVAGVDGTLKRRFPDAYSREIIRAKTGSIDGVHALAGYTPSADGELLAFVIILNDPNVKYGRMAPWVDEIARAVSQFTRK